ncbi:hypothetical protein [Allorhodopirellula solitaria]|uniref:TIGR02588 family protein n=1 Tax=Allorhodopirellula solitaria TaxID=2527987 RepID=A0A5C5X2U8_9BACT|nr:hypothetical protein [Allorhodopirellula solitaria]TWT56493.1 hypothetical protein CA85_40240 [Allorhodopirellula solitaria]
MKNGNQSAATIPLAECIVAGVGLLLVLATFGYLGQRAMREQSPPSFVARTEKIIALGDQFVAKVVVQNIGGTPVADLRVIADFGEDEPPKEVVIDYLPSRSDRRVGFVLKRMPSEPEPTFQFVSYTEP